MKSPVLVVLMLLSAVGAFAQTENARISGRVTDLTGAVIAGAQCKVTNIETDVSVTTITNEDGIYVLPDLHPVTYRLTIQKGGFRTVILVVSSRVSSTHQVLYTCSVVFRYARRLKRKREGICASGRRMECRRGLPAGPA